MNTIAIESYDTARAPPAGAPAGDAGPATRSDGRPGRHVRCAVQGTDRTR